MKAKGFTLIELMIVVAIIAIIAAIAIPNLLRSRMAANEAAAVAACKAFASAENIYRRTDYNHDGVLEYTMHLSGDNSLYENTAGAGDLALIDRSFAMAEGFPLPTGVTPVVANPKAGYSFHTCYGDWSSGTIVDWRDGNGRLMMGFGIYAMPNQYDGVGRNVFTISSQGTIYQKDFGQELPLPFNEYKVDSTWVVVE
ncbi:MAG TPA: DUF2950 family protein [Planctomycetota bacterium]|nr:DUF2950 family protein [Planctomycetota bacterium]